ncbi:phosphotransferase family protein [Quisquiliibacterium transsilvanicum]|uniref:Aminoglycoside phosphotransferase (APT) family kinase protein n=1 Tax=Quisquiliibacterium transsilvanicum TaxID=1549638 RepID=A0A7W8HGM1_9BURK|nr:phosphotransferase family protein [Quisquiliibacterium transsilvanicum]MBB5270840.1 aminoglycoside phosphotransferase (APT) family kinase protein [Quisquiliibacterium transsilvanicum]
MSSVVSAPPPDLGRLEPYLRSCVPAVGRLHGASRIVGGNSNPIWRLEADGGAYILRTQPAGALLKSAHALDREVRVITALHGSAVPVARIHVLCSDLDVIGVQFYLMDCVEGEVHRNVALPDVPPARREAVYRAALDSLLAIHRTDLAATGLSDFGRPGNYFERQLHRWSQQYRTAVPEGLPALDALVSALEPLVPREPAPTVLLHGDCRLDNLMFEPGTPRVKAVLDWELSTLGHPLADLGQFLGVQELPPDYLLPGLAGVDRAALGLPSQQALARYYLERSGLPVDTDLRFHKAFAMFRQAAMSAGLLRRAREGTAVAESALAFGESAEVFAEVGLAILAGPQGT